MGQFHIKQKGFSIVEALLAVAIFAIFTIGILYLALDTLKRDSGVELNNIALSYAQEGIEAVRSIRDQNFLLLENGDYGLEFNDEKWDFTNAPEEIEKFYLRTIKIEDVCRDEKGNISEFGIIDPDMKKIISEIVWNIGKVNPQKETLTTYFSNWPGSDWMITTCSEFTEGTFENTLAMPIPSPPEDNCILQLLTSEGDGSFRNYIRLDSHAADVAVKGDYAYVVKSNYNENFRVIDVTDKENIKEINIPNKNLLEDDGNTITIDGNYAYVGVKRDTSALTIIDIFNPLNPVKTGSVGLTQYGNTIDILGDYAYATVESLGNSFYIVDIKDKQNPIRIESSKIRFNNKAHAVAVSGNYAYIGLENDIIGFRVVDISNPNAPKQVAQLDVDEYGGNYRNNINSIILNGIFAYAGTEDEKNQLKVINISNPLNPTIINRLDVGGEINDLVISKNYMYAAVDETHAGLAVINISNPLAPKLAYTRDIYGKGNGIDADENNVYIAVETSNEGLVITNTGNANVVLNGDYTSIPFDSGSDNTRYNVIEWENIELSGSSVKFQIRTAAQLQDIETAVWAGPDGTNNSYYETSPTAIILNKESTGSRFIQFKVFLSSDGINSPVIENIKINYIP